ncbi:MAG: inositol monophosphatase [Actinomycetota bacterium]|nr:inositol monophosphatase [Actinomycetota bacterium]
MSELDALLELATRIARRAGELLHERFRRPAEGVSSKTSPTDLVSDADRDSEALLLSTIRDERPGDGILAEEGDTADSRSGITWIVDPLDGTINFLFGIPQWSISIAARDEDGLCVGVVHDPCRKETFTAVRGAGAFLNRDRIRVTDRTDLASALIGTGFAYDAEARAQQAARLPRLLPKVRDIRRAGSAALDLAWLACGRLDGFFEAPMEEWDKAAGMLLVTEAGGMVTRLDAPLGLSPGVIAANPTLHRSLRELVLGT